MVAIAVGGLEQAGWWREVPARFAHSASSSARWAASGSTIAASAAVPGET